MAWTLLWNILIYFERHSECKKYDGEHPFSFAFEIMKWEMCLCIYEWDVIVKHIVKDFIQVEWEDEAREVQELWMSILRMPIEFFESATSQLHSKIEAYVNNHIEAREKQAEIDPKSETGAEEKGKDEPLQEK